MRINVFYLAMQFLKLLYLCLSGLLSDDEPENSGKTNNLPAELRGINPSARIKSILCKPEKSGIFDKSESPYICFRCGRAMLDDFWLCTDCMSRPVFFALSYARHITGYGKNQRFFINQWKFRQNRVLGIPAATRLLEAYVENFEGLPVVPVPPREGRLLLAGFDCVGDVAFILRWCFGVKVLKPLVRIDSEEQKHKTFAGRTDKSKKRYALKTRRKLKYDAVVLIDDIMTTGGTLEECAALLKSAGVKQVYALTLFYA